MLKIHMLNLLFYVVFLTSLTALAKGLKPYQRCPDFYDFSAPDSVSVFLPISNLAGQRRSRSDRLKKKKKQNELSQCAPCAKKFTQ